MLEAVLEPVVNRGVHYRERVLGHRLGLDGDQRRALAEHTSAVLYGLAAAVAVVVVGETLAFVVQLPKGWAWLLAAFAVGGALHHATGRASETLEPALCHAYGVEPEDDPAAATGAA